MPSGGRKVVASKKKLTKGATTLRGLFKENKIFSFRCPHCSARIASPRLAEHFFELIVRAVESGQNVTVTGVGLFRAKRLAARDHKAGSFADGRCVAPERFTLAFKPHKQLKYRMTPILSKVLKARNNERGDSDT